MTVTKAPRDGGPDGDVREEQELELEVACHALQVEVRDARDGQSVDRRLEDERDPEPPGAPALDAPRDEDARDDVREDRVRALEDRERETERAVHEPERLLRRGR